MKNWCRLYEVIFIAMLLVPAYTFLLEDRARVVRMPGKNVSAILDNYREGWVETWRRIRDDY